jgi:hypothetical protein
VILDAGTTRTARHLDAGESADDEGPVQQLLDRPFVVSVGLPPGPENL